ncbi:UNVERIFIED_ORG: hypothetical protein ABIC97_004423 [Peribacillus simplex]
MKHLTEMLRGVLEGVVLQKIQTGETGNPTCTAAGWE